MLELELMGVTLDAQHQAFVFLRHGERFLPIVVGLAEADAIHAGIVHRDLGRPMTHDLICNLLAGLHGELKSVNIYKLENETFYAHLNIEQKGDDGQVEQVLRVDSRPSDGIAIACRVGCPIFAAEDVMDQAGQDLSILTAAEEDSEGEHEEEDEEDEDEDFRE